ncbi:hypothetical protein AB595_21900 [Massilia sp. WF1]|uniref:PilN domain-containing protein n=1 Tax=unclassified Massilia TaxID=2609279 RepID=UPI0006493064|nr:MULTISPECIES: PilN domain-containing protein [unclassified Massilia]ALK97070.1 hypothetical protein AM586_13235 [Massilia sp. WG5]KLU34745.1 hypothetical protein AB595_21900 [Massilia sp. WF1]
MTRQINLFNPAFEKQTTLFSARSMAVSCGVLVLGLAGLAGWSQLRLAQLQGEAGADAHRLEVAQKRLAAVSAEFAPRRNDPALAAQLAEAEQEQAALQHVSQVIERGDLGNTHGYAEYFRALARQSADGLWLTAVSVGGAGREIGVQGRAVDPAMVPGFLKRLRNEPVLQGTAVGSLQIGEASALKQTSADGKESSVPAPYVEFSLQSTPAGAKP